MVASGLVTSGCMAELRGRLDQLVRLLGEHTFLRSNPVTPPLNDLTSIRALVEFQYLRSDLLADHRSLQGGIVASRLACSRGSKGWRETIEDVTQEAQSKLSKKLHRADEWTYPAQAIAARCANDAATEFLRREQCQPQLTSSPLEEDSDVARHAGDAETVWDHIALRRLVDKATGLATSAGASLQDTKLWVWADVVDRRFRLGGKELAEQFELRPNAVYQGIYRAGQKVLSHLERELRLSADEAAVLANDMRAKSRLAPAQLAKERELHLDDVARLSRELRARVAAYLDAIEAER